MFLTIITKPKIYARIDFESKYFIFIKLWKINNKTRIASQTLLFQQSLFLKRNTLQVFLPFSAMDEAPA